MNTDKAYSLAVLCGLSAGGIVYGFLLPDWFFALGVGTVYTGIGYFYFAYDIPLLGEHISFTEKPDKLGHAIGLFGVSISPLAVVEYAEFRTPETAGILVWTTGLIAYLLFVSAAQSQQQQ